MEGNLGASAALAVLFFLMLPWILTGIVWWIAGLFTEGNYDGR